MALSSQTSPRENSGLSNHFFSTFPFSLLMSIFSTVLSLFTSNSGCLCFNSLANSFRSTNQYRFNRCIHVGHHLSPLPINPFLSIQHQVLLLFTYICSVQFELRLNVIESQDTRHVQLNSSNIILLSNSLALVRKLSSSFR